MTDKQTVTTNHAKAQKIWDTVAPKLWNDTAWRETQVQHNYDYVLLIERILDGKL